ncbi:type I-F CRISPR-associated protein Csy1 [Rhodanobacter sp. 115]|uniref:type I-F CRISPR-associated protein Csy1 n=1 Tax=Rhodanobacter sp. FW021-MT20 TaxID=1162282 RepID=UPI00056A16EB|nr:type I-F CRISPR-associated protein Csy1 [Rhodanobacter sp. 115]
MNELTDRGKAFHAAIAGFIGNKLKKAPRGEDGNYAAASKTECEAWLFNAVKNIGNASVATHPIRITHSSIKGATSIYAEPSQLTPREELGTHSVAGEFSTDFAIGNSPQVPACQLLQQRGPDGASLASWLAAGDSDLAAALDSSAGDDGFIAETLAKALKPENGAISSGLAKQVYWLAGDEPQDNSHYHLLQPMFSSTLEDALHGPISRATDAYFNARGTQKKRATYADHATYPGIVRRNIGGANPQNVSPLNSVRHGNNYLLSSLPPPAWKPRGGVNLLKIDSVFDEKRGALNGFGGMRELLRTLADFLKQSPDPTMETRTRRETIEQAVGAELAMFGVAIHGNYAAGWTRDDTCSLPLCEQLWLDPDRTELPERHDPQHPHWQELDREFNDAYERGDWADEVAGRFGRWVNQQLRNRSDKLIALGEAEMRHFARQAILDVAWPIPLQRRAKAGVA